VGLDSSRLRLVLAALALQGALIGAAPRARAAGPDWAKPLSPEPAVPTKPDAAWIHAKMLAVYAGLASYQDAGTLRATVTEGARPPRALIRGFATAFVREAKKFRFLIQQEPGSSAEQPDIVWRDGTQLRAWRGSLRREVKADRLDAAVSQAARFTELPWAFHVLGLLLPEVGPLWPELPGTKVLTRVADGTHEGRSCYRVQLLDRSMGIAKRIFWIEKGSHHLFRLDEVAEVDLADGPDVRVEKQIVYRPVYNRPVSPEALAYEVGPLKVSDPVR
jgi:hypothetical protein